MGYFDPDFTFVGLRNFQRLFSTIPTDRFLCDLRNTVTFTVLFLVACIVIGFLLAVLLDRHVKGEGIFRNIFLFPMAISYIVTGVVWRWILSPGNAQSGATGLNLLFDKLGLGFLKWGWFTDPAILYIHPESGFGTFLGHVGLGGLASPYVGVSLAMISVVLAATWQMSGYTDGHVPRGASRDPHGNEGGGPRGRGHRAPGLPPRDRSHDPPGDPERDHRPGAHIAEDLRPRRVHDRTGARLRHGRAGILHVGHDLPRQQLRAGRGNRDDPPAPGGAAHHSLPRFDDASEVRR